MKIKLLNVRLSFPHLFEKHSMEPNAPEEKKKFSAAFILDKTVHAATIKEIQSGIAAVAKEKWPKGVPSTMQPCLRDGSTKPDLDGYGDGTMFLNASNTKVVAVVDNNRAPLTRTDNKPYAGCYVNAVIQLWAQDNTYGKRVNAQLQAVQFVRNGEPFGDKGVDVDEEFEVLPDEADSVL